MSLLMVTGILSLLSLCSVAAQSVPQHRYGSYFGGDRFDRGRGVTVDKSGNIYIVGVTTSEDVPTTPKVFSQAYDLVNRSRDIFVAKFDPTGQRLIWGTYVGGTGNDDPVGGVRIGSAGEVIVAGVTTSGNFPVRPGALTSLPPLGTNGFIFALKPDGSDLIWSTFIGGSGEDTVVAFDINVQNELVIVGHSSSTDLPVPTTGSFDSSPNGGIDAFVLRLTSNANAVISGSYLGGAGNDFASNMKLEPGGATFITGYTASNGFPKTTAASRVGGFDAFALKLRFDHSVLDFGTLVGGSGDDFSRAIAVDRTGNMYITGETTSGDYPDNVGLSSPGSWFATKINALSGGLDYSLYLSSDAVSRGTGIAVDQAGRAVLVGSTASDIFPIIGDGEQTPGLGKRDIAIVRLAPTGLNMEQASVIGGSEDEETAGHFLLTSYGDIYLTGITRSENFPLTRFPFDSTLNKTSRTESDGYLLIWSLNKRPNLVVPPLHIFDTLACDTVIVDSIYVYNDGNDTLIIDQNFLRTTDGKFTLLEPDDITNIALLPGDSLLYVIRYSTNGVGFSENEILIGSTDSLIGKRQISIALRAGRLAQSLQPLPGLVFGQVLVCSDSTIVIPLFNNGRDSVTVLQPTFSSGGDVFSIEQPPTFPLKIPENKSVSLRVKFSPNNSGLFNGQLDVPVAECDFQSLHIPLTGRGEKVSVEGIPDTVLFAPLGFCEKSHDTTITIKNRSGVNIILRSGTIAGTGFLLGGGVALPDTILPNGELILPLKFLPDQEGDFEAKLLLEVQPCDTTYSIILRGSQSALSLPTVNHDTIDFGRVISCQNLPLALDSLIQISNPSALPVVLGNITLAPPFELIQCGLSSIPTRVDPNSTVRICLRYTPFNVGVEGQELLIPFTVGSCEDTLRVFLMGEHIIPKLTVDEDILDIGVLEACTSSHDTSFVLRNNTGQEITVVDGLVTSGLSILSPPFPQVVAANDSVRIFLRFQPNQAGSSVERIRIVTSPCQDTLDVELRGTIDGVVLKGDRDSITFAPQLACDPANRSFDTISLSWSGTTIDPVRVKSIRLRGSFGEVTLLDSILLVGAEVPDGGSLDLPLQFAATTAGEYRDTLEVVLEPCLDTLLFPLRGESVEPNLIVSSGLFPNDVPVNSVASRFLNITNNSLVPLDLTLGSLPKLPFELDLSGINFPVRLEPGELLSIPVTFSPTNVGEVTDSVAFLLTNGCDYTRRILLRGTGILDEEEAEFCIRGLYSNPGHNGDTVEIEIETEAKVLKGG
ncbi:MAG: SBBP repeat-containing protein, partial [Candidatus Kapaibacterium sp.]